MITAEDKSVPEQPKLEESLAPIATPIESKTQINSSAEVTTTKKKANNLPSIWIFMAFILFIAVVALFFLSRRSTRRDVMKPEKLASEGSQTNKTELLQKKQEPKKLTGKTK